MIVTLWIVLGISALVLIFARSVAVELFASANQVAAVQADAVAKGALQYVIAQLDNSDGAIPDPTTFPCQAVSIGAGYFWILRPPGDSETAYCFGLVDEASKLNLNSATADELMNLPNMTVAIANSIVNWRSPESAASSDGASDSYYLSLPQPYNCKHAPFETVEELLLVQGVTPQLLYGDDTNRNGILDPNEFDTSLGVSGSSVSTGSAVDGGWNNDVTVYSAQPATTTAGGGRSGGTGSRAGGGGTSGRRRNRHGRERRRNRHERRNRHGHGRPHGHRRRDCRHDRQRRLDQCEHRPDAGAAVPARPRPGRRQRDDQLSQQHRRRREHHRLGLHGDRADQGGGAGEPHHRPVVSVRRRYRRRQRQRPRLQALSRDRGRHHQSAPGAVLERPHVPGLAAGPDHPDLAAQRNRDLGPAASSTGGLW